MIGKAPREFHNNICGLIRPVVFLSAVGEKGPLPIRTAITLRSGIRRTEQDLINLTRSDPSLYVPI